ncbi:TOBE domain-containing protein, partial [Clostridium sp.]|uniref:TOBE domain-containing protein n=2 Tax=Clostridium sp. TaxID=1506 RepID=UPI002FDD7EC7
MIANYQPYENYYNNFQYFCPWVRYRSKSHHSSNTTTKMALSARNQFIGKISKIIKGTVVGQVVVDIGCGNSMSSVITTASIEELGLRVGLRVRVIVKSTSVMIMNSSSNMASNSNNMMPDSNNMMPNSNNMTPNSNNIMPNSNNMTPNSNNIMPNSNNMMPNSSNMMPNSSNMMPNSSNMMP